MFSQNYKNSILLTLCFLSSPWISAEENLSAIDQDALLKTQKMLVSPAERSAYIEKNPNARSAADQVKALGLSPEEQERIYKLSGSILESMAKESGGNGQVMAEKAAAYQRNPASIEGSLSPEQLHEIKRLSESIKNKSK